MRCRYKWGCVCGNVFHGDNTAAGVETSLWPAARSGKIGPVPQSGPFQTKWPVPNKVARSKQSGPFQTHSVCSGRFQQRRKTLTSPEFYDERVKHAMNDRMTAESINARPPGRTKTIAGLIAMMAGMTGQACVAGQNVAASATADQRPILSTSSATIWATAMCTVWHRTPAGFPRRMRISWRVRA